MIIASAKIVKNVSFVNGNMILKFEDQRSEFVPNEILKYYSVSGIIDAEKSNNFIIRKWKFI